MRIQRALSISVGAALVIAAAFGDAKNLGDEHNYRIGGDLVPSDQNECAGVPSCLSATLPATSVPGRGRTEKTFACPPSHPNLWNWDAAQHEHVLVKLIDVDQFTVTVEGVNAASTPGDFVVSLGCSPEPYAGTGIQLSRQLAPTSQLQKRKPARGSGKGPKHVVGQVGGDACDNVPDCQLQQQPTFAMGGWATTTKSYACASPYPYAWGFTYTQTGSPSVSAIGANFEESPGTQDILLTNWNPFATDDVRSSWPAPRATCGAGAAARHSPIPDVRRFPARHTCTAARARSRCASRRIRNDVRRTTSCIAARSTSSSHGVSLAPVNRLH